MRQALIFLALIALGGPAFAQNWSTQDKVLFATSSVLLVADWAQTRHIARNPDRFFEKNPILGEHPSVGRVNTYFATTLVLNYIVTDALPPKWRTAYQAGLIGVELYVVGNNKRIGIRMDF